MKKAIDNNGVEQEVSKATIVRTVNGIHYLLTQEEKDAQEARKVAWTVKKTHRDAMAEILRLENQISQRRMREAVLGIDNGWLARQDAKISTERSKL